MKKKSCLTLALILVIVQVVSLFAVLPVSAETTTKSYSLVKATEPMTVDGKADEAAWAIADWSSPFVKVGGNYDGASSCNVQLKAMWEPAENDKMNVYILVVAKGVEIPPSKWANGNSIQIQMGNEAGTEYFWSGLRNLKTQIIENATAPNLTDGGSVADWSKSYQLAAVEDIAGSKTVTYEFCYQMDKADSIKFDVMVRGGFYGSRWQTMDYSWANTTNATMEQAPTGVGIIDDPMVTTTHGASIRIDTTEAKTSGIRFESSVDMARYNALVAEGATITTGTLIVPTENLTKKSITGAFDKEALTNSGLVENTHFYDIVNVDNEWVSGNDGTWYATLYNIQDYTREFTAVGYVTVTIGDETTTYYGVPSESRSIAQVAQTLMSGETEGDEGKWTAAQEAVLKNFFTQEAQS